MLKITPADVENLQVILRYKKCEKFEDERLRIWPELIREMIVFSLDFCTQSSKKRPVLGDGECKYMPPFVGVQQLDTLICYSQEFHQNNQKTCDGLTQLSLTQD